MADPTLPIRLVALDIDRTTLTDDHRITDPVRAAVARAVAAGLIVVPATARNPASLRAIAAELGIGGHAIALNGAWTGSLGPTGGADRATHVARLPTEHVPAILKDAESAGLNPCWFTAQFGCALSEGPLTERERITTGQPIHIATLDDAVRSEVLKLLLLEPEPGTIDRLDPTWRGRLRFVRSGDRLIEVVAPGVDKRAALEILAEALEIPRACVAAIGDSENDLASIEWAGFGIAMGNGTREFRAAADIVVATNAESGAAEALDLVLARGR